MQSFLSTTQNDMILLCMPDYMNIGAQGEGPSLNLTNTLKDCYSYKSKTFANQILTGRTEGRFLNKWQVQELELFII